MKIKFISALLFSLFVVTSSYASVTKISPIKKLGKKVSPLKLQCRTSVSSISYVRCVGADGTYASGYYAVASTTTKTVCTDGGQPVITTTIESPVAGDPCY
jgi:hypothetical protein